MTDIDLTDYVEVGSRAHITHNTELNWDEMHPLSKFVVRETIAPIVEAVLHAYHEANPVEDRTWLEGIG